jgi:hypothetical protein
VLIELGLKKPVLRDFLRDCLSLFFLIFVVSIFLTLILSFLNFNDLQVVENKIRFFLREQPFLLAYFLIVRVFAEEVFFRGFLIKRIGLLASTVLFALLHGFYGSVLEVLGAFVLGFILGYYFIKKNSLYSIIGAHFLYNFTVLFFIVFM